MATLLKTFIVIFLGARRFLFLLIVLAFIIFLFGFIVLGILVILILVILIVLILRILLLTFIHILAIFFAALGLLLLDLLVGVDSFGGFVVFIILVLDVQLLHGFVVLVLGV